VTIPLNGWNRSNWRVGLGPGARKYTRRFAHELHRNGTRHPDCTGKDAVSQTPAERTTYTAQTHDHAMETEARMYMGGDESRVEKSRETALCS